MSAWANNLAAGKCGRCGQRKPARGKTRCADCAAAVNLARAEWAKRNPEKDQENKNRYWKSKKGKRFIKARAARFNLYRKYWRSGQKRGSTATGVFGA